MSWRFWQRRRASGLTEEQRAALKSLVADARYELIPLSNALDRAAALPRGSQVTVTASPSHGIEATFDLGAVTRWVGEVRDAGITLPLHLGVPGVADLPKLMKVAARIGVADSARYLKKNKQLLGHLVRGGSFGPDAFLERLAPMLADPVADVRVLHVFTFNQVEQTAAWQRRMLEELGG